MTFGRLMTNGTSRYKISDDRDDGLATTKEDVLW
jgi:hypothetical protein